MLKYKTEEISWEVMEEGYKRELITGTKDKVVLCEFSITGIP